MLSNFTPPMYDSPIGQGRFASTMFVNAGGFVDSVAGLAAIKVCRVALIGLPDDNGVELNGGRVGAAQGPAAFRSALARYGVAQPEGFDWPLVFDAGDVKPASGRGEAALHETHARVTSGVREVLDLGLFPVAVGGGHDLTFPFARAVIEHGRERGPAIDRVVYFDAHLDVRATVGSGMSFRQLVETCGVKSLLACGVKALANSREHVEWFRGHGGVIHDAANELHVPTTPSVVSFDLDVLDAAHAPGVSAVNPAGMTASDAAAIVEHFGACEHVRCFDLMELCPPHDVGGRTARVAAHLFLQFLRGLARRPGRSGGGA